MEWALHRPGTRARVVVACSGELYCAADLLNRVELGELDVDVVALVSDKEVAAPLAARHDVPFVHVGGGLVGRRAGGPGGRLRRSASPTSPPIWWCWPATCGSCPRRSPPRGRGG